MAANPPNIPLQNIQHIPVASSNRFANRAVKKALRTLNGWHPLKVERHQSFIPVFHPKFSRL
jgi:hypothetical protein